MQHFNIDKKAYKLLKKERTNIDRAMLFIGSIGPLATLPQVFLVYTKREVAGISILSWTLYLLINLLALCYALIHRLKPLIIANTLWVIIDVSMITGFIIFS